MIRIGVIASIVTRTIGIAMVVVKVYVISMIVVAIEKTFASIVITTIIIGRLNMKLIKKG